MDFPIGFLDSGIGGASILEKLVQKIPEENFVYYADVNNAPYGNKSNKKVKNCVLEGVRYLVEKRLIKMLVVACNTASSSAKAEINRLFPDLQCVYVEPPIKVAIDKNKKNILVLATKRTIKNNKNLKFYIKKTKGSNIKIKPLFIKNLAKMIDNNYDDKELIEEVLKKKIKQKNYDAVVLGCTHYNFIKKDLKKHLNSAEIISSETGVVNRILSLLKSSQTKMCQSGDIEIVMNGNNDLVLSRLMKMFPSAHTSQKY